MKRTEAQTIGQIVESFLHEEHLDTQLDELRASALWPQVVGQGINRYTASRSVAGGVMTVHITSAPLRNELMLMRTSIIQRINDALGREVIHEIIFK